MNMKFGSKYLRRSITVCALACTAMITGCVQDETTLASGKPAGSKEEGLSDMERELGVSRHRSEPVPPGKREDFKKAYFVFADWKTKTKREYDVKSAAEAYQILDVLRKGYLSKYLLPGGRDMVPEYFVIDFRKGASIQVEIGLLDDEKRWSKEARDLFKKYMKKSKVIGKIEPMDP